ncbi:hypothetical protein HMPREF2891_00135 [Actinomyces sp. HMSC065F11]|nr:hypothetical protein HMPREF2891_00135 [Actinomyces sp. HMSC065F11]
MTNRYSEGKWRFGRLFHQFGSDSLMRGPAPRHLGSESREKAKGKTRGQGAEGRSLKWFAGLRTACGIPAFAGFLG